MRRTLRTILLLSTLLMLAAPAIPVQADVAPPENPPGSNIGPDQKTKVQMVAEEVVFDVPSMPEWDDFLVDMTATFHMKNQGGQSESMRVGFPLGCGPIPGEATATVDGRAGDVVQEEGEPIILPLPPGYDGPDEPCETMPWIRFDVTFPPGQEVEIVVKQTYRPSELTNSFAAFGYILESGSGWYSKIGKGSVVFNLPYKPDDYNFHGWWNSTLTLSRFYGDNFIRFTFNDLEPTSNNNLIFELGIPYTWQPVDAAKQAVADHPDDPNAYIQLGKAYQEASWDLPTLQGHGEPRESIMKLALKAYERAVQIDPYAVEAHLGIADMIYEANTAQPWMEVDVYSSKLKPVLDHLSKALALAPDNQEAVDLRNSLSYYAKESVVLPTVNPTWLPTATITLTPSDTPIPTNTLPATQTKNVTSTATAIKKTNTPRPSRIGYQTFTPQPPLQSATAVVYKTATATTTATPSAPRQSTVQSRLWIYLAMILVMGGIAYLMWRRDQGN
jgi:hypothetical protein